MCARAILAGTSVFRLNPATLSGRRCAHVDSYILHTHPLADINRLAATAQPDVAEVVDHLDAKTGIKRSKRWPAMTRAGSAHATSLFDARLSAQPKFVCVSAYRRFRARYPSTKPV